MAVLDPIKPTILAVRIIPNIDRGLAAKIGLADPVSYTHLDVYKRQLQGLAELAGDFVVTVAGPNLESQIAGRGSGAAEWSRQHYATVVTVDIGGGSSNAAVFRSGRHAASAASMVGGRQLTLDADGRVTHIAPSGVAIIADLGIHGLAVGQTATAASLRLSLIHI